MTNILAYIVLFTTCLVEQSTMTKPVLTKVIIVLTLLVGFAAQLGNVNAKETPKEGKEGGWTKQVDKSIQFGAEAEKRSADKALNAVQKISKNIQALKTDVIDLNKDLRLMEEQLLFPSSTKFSVFVSLDTGQFFTLESIKLKIDGKLVVTHLYSDLQRQAMARGGIQKLYVTNLNEGKHSFTAFFTGLGPNGRPYKRAKDIEFEKGPGSGFVELAIIDDGSIQESTFEIKLW